MEEITKFLKIDETSEVQQSNREKDWVPCRKLEQKDKEPVEKPSNKLSYVGKGSEQHDII